MRANFNNLPALNLISNIPFEVGPDAPSQMEYIANVADTMMGNNWVVARLDPASYIRRRNPETNKLVHRMDLPRITVRSALEDRMIGSREHFDISVKPARVTYTPTTRHRWTAFANLSKIALQGDKILDTAEYRYLKPGYPAALVPVQANQLLMAIIQKITTVIRAGVFNIPCQIEVTADSPKTEVPHDLFTPADSNVHDRIKKPLR